MSNRIVNEAIAYTNRSLLRSAARTVLICLAQVARDSDRMTWVSVQKLSVMSSYSIPSVKRSLAELTKAGIIRRAEDEEIPSEALRYKSAVRIINPAIEWPFTGEAIVESKKEFRQRAVEEHSLNQENFAWGDTDNEPPVDKPKIATGTRAEVHLQRKQGRIDAAKYWHSLKGKPEYSLSTDKNWLYNLANHFVWLADNSGSGKPDAQNVGALRDSMRRWHVADGLSREVISAMIDVYWEDYYPRSSSVPSWKDFLKERFTLLDLVEREAAVVEVKTQPTQEPFVSWLDRYENSRKQETS